MSRKRFGLVLLAVLFLASQALMGAPPMQGKVLVKGSPLHGANGIFFDKDDRLHIASAFGQEILVMDPQNGKIIKRIGPEVGVGVPDDVAFGPDGSLYWTSIASGFVYRLTPDGKKTSQFVALGVNPITFSDSGRLFVALFLFGEGLFELDPNLVTPPRRIQLSPNEGMLNGFDFGRDGYLYSPLPLMGMVVKINVDSGATSAVAGGFVAVSAVKFDSLGRLHALDPESGTVTRIDTATGNKEVIAQLGSHGEWDNLAFDSRDRLYVSNSRDGSIIEILPSGQPRTVSEGGMVLPGGVAAMMRAGRESVFVADGWTLREFDALTGKAMGVEQSSFLPNGLLAPITISVDGSSLVMTSWLTNNTVEVWNPDTKQVLENYRDFAAPMNAIRFQGDLVVAELGTDPARVVRVTSAGRTTLATGLGVPIGLAARGGDLWVGDWAIGAVFQIVAGGVALAKPHPVATGLKFPEGLAVDRDGSLLVVETGTGRLLRIDTGSTTVLAEGLELGLAPAPGVPLPPTFFFNGVAVGPSGTIYVTGDRANVLYRLAPADNKPPVPVVKPQSTTTPQREVWLDGSESSDPEGEPLTYSWKSTGKSAALMKADTAKAIVQFGEGSGAYSFELTVTDPKGASAKAVATVLYIGR